MRERFRWTVQLQGESGKVIDYPFTTYWDPEPEDAAAAVANAAQAQAYIEHNKREKYFPTKVERVA
jgi:hypothetical protein